MKRTNITKVLYAIRIIFLVASLVMIIMLLPHLLKAKWSGIFLLVSYSLLVITTLITILSHKEKFKIQISYHLIYIASLLYLTLIWVRIFLDSRLELDAIYQINISYIQNNSIILGIVFLGVIFNSLLLWFDKDNTI